MASDTDIINILSRVDSAGEIMAESDFSRIDHYIGTGNYIQNAELSGSLFGGIPNNRSVAWAGPAGVGKTFALLNVAREAQKMGYIIIFCDSENAVDQTTMENFGIDLERVMYRPVSTVSEFRTYVSKICNSLEEQKKQRRGDPPRIMLMLDSLGNLSTTKETNDILNGVDKRDMTRAQELKGAFRVITMALAKQKIPFLATNHTYMTQDMFPKQVFSGGTGGMYNFSIILMMTKAQLRDAEDSAPGAVKTGIIVTIKPEKNRFARPIPVKYHISFYKGMNPYVGLEEYVSWEACGIGRGKLVPKIVEVPVLNDDGTPVIFRGKPKVERRQEGMEYVPGDRGWAVRHLGRTISAKEFFTPEVFTEEVLRELDEKVIRPAFMLPKLTSLNDLHEMTGLAGADACEGDAPQASAQPAEAVTEPDAPDSSDF